MSFHARASKDRRTQEWVHHQCQLWRLALYGPNQARYCICMGWGDLWVTWIRGSQESNEKPRWQNVSTNSSKGKSSWEKEDHWDIMWRGPFPCSLRQWASFRYWSQLLRSTWSILSREKVGWTWRNHRWASVRSRISNVHSLILWLRQSEIQLPSLHQERCRLWHGCDRRCGPRRQRSSKWTSHYSAICACNSRPSWRPWKAKRECVPHPKACEVSNA